MFIITFWATRRYDHFEQGPLHRHNVGDATRRHGFGVREGEVRDPNYARRSRNSVIRPLLRYR